MDTLYDYLQLLNKYGYIPFPELSDKLIINFELLSKDYDAFHLTKKAASALRSMILYDELYHLAHYFYDYDVESYIIFHLDYIDKSSIHKIILPDNFYDD